MPATRQFIAHEAYLRACELELRAFKPGNVSIHSEGHDMTVEDFRISARVSAPYLADPELPLGEKIFRAIEATRGAVGCNTNLGIVLLAAPLIQAFIQPTGHASFHDAVRSVLNNTTVADAEWVYRAIRLAQPAGLGEAPEQDVASTPNVSLLEVMRLAAQRDSVARQYSGSFADVFHNAIPMYHVGLSLWDDEEWAAVAVFVGLLARFHDSHIERKFGAAIAQEVTELMLSVEDRLTASTTTPLQRMEVLREIDREFKTRGINPGTSADLTVATVLAAQLLSRYQDV
ncbi:MAG: triphosphoribosyl-dephospho-CoA synthase [Methylococcus sp.]